MAPVIFFKHWYYWKCTQKSVCPHLHFWAVFSLQMSSAIEISTILATPKVTKTYDIWINNVFLTFLKATFHPKVMRTPFWMYFTRLSEGFMSVCDKYLHFVFNITANTSSDFYKSYRRLQAKLFSPPEPSRTKFTPSGRVFRPSRPLAWTLHVLCMWPIAFELQQKSGKLNLFLKWIWSVK